MEKKLKKSWFVEKCYLFWKKPIKKHLQNYTKKNKKNKKKKTKKTKKKKQNKTKQNKTNKKKERKKKKKKEKKKKKNQFNLLEHIWCEFHVKYLYDNNRNDTWLRWDHRPTLLQQKEHNVREKIDASKKNKTKQKQKKRKTKTIFYY